MAKKKLSKPSSAESLLVELLTEELPPRALNRLSVAFADALTNYLKDKGFIDHNDFEEFSTPRRLAVVIPRVLDKQPDRQLERKGPAVAAALDAAGKPTGALIGFARSCGVDPAKLHRVSGDKGEYFVHRTRHKGEALKRHLAALVEAALAKLPIPKVMRWGNGEAQFVRPVHGLVMLHGSRIVPGEVMGLKSGRATRGHRFMSRGVVPIRHADVYEQILETRGKVIPDAEERARWIEKQLDREARKLGKTVTWTVGRSIELLEEVTSLVEYPVVYAGSYDRRFLEVPEECLIVTMQQHQRYFPLKDGEPTKGRLLPNFLFVSNVRTTTPKNIISGNERVLRARLADAKFFFDQDRKHRLEERVPRLANVVYHNKLGSQLERVQRLVKLAGHIAQLLGADVGATERAAWLSKADLLTEMVGEFPELQGIMGKYYARHDGELPVVAEAIEAHYLPRGARGALPHGHEAVATALADRLDTLVGIYGIGLAPTGEKDPFGLRRAALGVARILIEQSLPLDVLDLLERARTLFPNGVVSEGVTQDLRSFFHDRLRPYLRDRGFAPDEIDSVLALNSTRFDHLLPRLEALRKFRELPEGMALAAANKRIHNILRQAADGDPDRITPAIDSTLLQEDAEKKLARQLGEISRRVHPLVASGDYAQALQELSRLRGAVDEFFDRVMVMVEDEHLRGSRLQMLAAIRHEFRQIADISRLQG